MAQEVPDYHQVLERNDIDAVRAGKDVYVEKPLTKSLAEGPLMEKAVAETGRAVQVGYQQRSWEHFKAARGVVASSKFGRVPLVLSSWYQIVTQSRCPARPPRPRMSGGLPTTRTVAGQLREPR